MTEAKSTSSERPEFCPTCGARIGLSTPIVRIDKGPWTCEACDGRLSTQPQDKEQA